MTDENALVLELMLQAEVFCCQVEAIAKKTLPLAEMHTLSLKISQCRGALRTLQEKYENDVLDTADTGVLADFRALTIMLLWVSYLGARCVDRKLFRKLVSIESGFTYLLITRRPPSCAD